MAKLTDLKPGDFLVCSMKLGFALYTTVDGKGNPYRAAPTNARASTEDLAAFVGILKSYDPATGFLDLWTQPYTQAMSSFNVWGDQLPAQVHYKFFQRIRRVSQHATPPTVRFNRPGREALGGDFKAYRTIEEIQLR